MQDCWAEVMHLATDGGVLVRDEGTAKAEGEVGALLCHADADS